MAFLVWDSPHGRVVHALERAITIVGSDPVADLRVEAASVSRRHALIQVEGDKVKITDLHSEIGTRINGATIVPDLPSTLEPGDFVHVGGVVLSFHRTKPPAALPATKKSGARTPVGGGAGAAARNFPWKWTAVGLGVVALVCAGVLVGLKLSGGKPEEPATGGGADPKGTGTVAKEAPTGEAKTSTPPKPAEPEKPPKQTEDSPQEGLPPARHAAVQTCPELLETSDGTFIPVQLTTWDAARFDVVGADGKRYRVARRLVRRVVDRADLARRAQKRIEAQPVEEIKGSFELAQWCFQRHVREPLREFLKRVLAQRPGDPVKRFLDAIETGAIAAEADDAGGKSD